MALIGHVTHRPSTRAALEADDLGSGANLLLSNWAEGRGLASARFDLRATWWQPGSINGGTALDATYRDDGQARSTSIALSNPACLERPAIRS